MNSLDVGQGSLSRVLGVSSTNQIGLQRNPQDLGLMDTLALSWVKNGQCQNDEPRNMVTMIPNNGPLFLRGLFQMDPYFSLFDIKMMIPKKQKG
jgi:hypothetical protein